MKTSEILRQDGPKYKQARNTFGKGEYRCACGVIASHYGWDADNKWDVIWGYFTRHKNNNDGKHFNQPRISLMNDRDKLSFEQIAKILEAEGD